MEQRLLIRLSTNEQRFASLYGLGEAARGHGMPPRRGLPAASLMSALGRLWGRICPSLIAAVSPSIRVVRLGPDGRKS